MLRATAAVVLTALIGLNPMAAPVARTEAEGVVYRQTLPGVAWVVTEKSAAAGQPRVVEGTAWVADVRQRFLVTNHHVAAKGDAVRVYFPTEGQLGEVATSRDWYETHRPGIPGRVVAANEKKDLAVIQVPELPPGVKALKLAGESPTPGETTYTVGNAGSNQPLWGCANGTVRGVYNVTRPDFVGRVVESSVPADRGASGSPVVNAAGEVVGVVFARTRDGRSVTLCVEAAEVRSLLEQAEREVAKAEPRQAPQTGRRANPW
jgi:putative serine protease PepD